VSTSESSATPSPPRHKFRNAFRTRERRYPIWSAKVIVSIALIGVILTALLVILMGHQRLLVELEMTLGIVAGGLFLFLTTGLYLGARVKKHEPLAGDLAFYTGENVFNRADVSSGFDIGDVGGGDDLLGCLLGIVVGILLSVLVVVLLVVFINLAIVVFFLFMLAVGWIFHRALRTVFARSKRCRGDLLASLGYAAFYTFLYTGWLLAILLAVEWARTRV